jgi:hypothetical protein
MPDVPVDAHADDSANNQEAKAKVGQSDDAAVFMSPAELHFWDMLVRSMRMAVVRKLLHNNAAQSFTTEQYRDAYLASYPGVAGVVPERREQGWDRWALMHLLNLATVVRQGPPHVWTPIVHEEKTT